MWYTVEAETSYAFDLQRSALEGSPIVENTVGAFLVGRIGLMRTRRRQRPRRIRHFAPPLLDADSNLPGVTGLRGSAAWIVDVRSPRRQALDRLHARDWGDR